MGNDLQTQLVSTKLIVHELEPMGAFYCEAWGFEVWSTLTPTRIVEAEIDGEKIDEILLGQAGQGGAGLILMKYVDRAPPPNGEVALVFMTDDIEALFARVEAAGGSILVPPDQSDVTPFKAGFAKDPEGHLIEVIERPASA